MMPIPAWRQIPDHLFSRDWMWRNLRTKRGRQHYDLHKETAEPVSRQIKQDRGFQQILRPILEKVN